MTRWQYFKFKYYWQPIGRSWNYSLRFPWPGFWLSLPQNTLNRLGKIFSWGNFCVICKKRHFDGRKKLYEKP